MLDLTTRLTILPGNTFHRCKRDRQVHPVIVSFRFVSFRFVSFGFVFRCDAMWSQRCVCQRCQLWHCSIMAFAYTITIRFIHTFLWILSSTTRYRFPLIEQSRAEGARAVALCTHIYYYLALVDIIEFKWFESLREEAEKANRRCLSFAKALECTMHHAVVAYIILKSRCSHAYSQKTESFEQQLGARWKCGRFCCLRPESSWLFA